MRAPSLKSLFPSTADLILIELVVIVFVEVVRLVEVLGVFHEKL
jgi:hypothetical protein